MSADKSSQPKPPIYKKWWFWAIIIIAVIAIGGGIGSSSQDPQKIGEGGGSESTKDSPTEKNIFKVNDVIKLDGYEVVVSQVERDYQSSNQFIKPNDGNEFIRIHVEVKNNSSDKKSYNYTDWELEDANGALTSVDIAGYSADDSGLGYGDLTSGGKKTGTLVFQIPKGQTGLKLHYKPTWSFNDKEAIIEL